ncbi:serine/threonine-protein kinase RsbW [Serratia fonticola]|jgi:serine/threonine-protein kinase RsbW|uniref:Serine/threonine-protein kinase RsbW n=1 Tax=Serratia fonticola TaxID=47917 RepID=A0A542CZN0_SERFO|nr:ATP-binding protein [Serratia fonticola]TQI81703.1 serine/threonine-protein kinase RsbW [Serratia fonticola]TQI96273.1 serine/threonine-protein kinase RsbW [Serratia fonticola]TVZ70771.1 serine/threonine-protein kinase RsbW [Serratia fonticola]
MANANMTLSLPASLGSLAKLSNALYDFVAPFSLDPTMIYQVDLASSEAFTNIVKHAVNYDDNQNVMITLANDGHHLTLTLSDRGLAIPDDILQQWVTPPELSPDPLDQASWPEGGMGLILIRSVMDTVRYETSNGCNRLTLIKNLSRQ